MFIFLWMSLANQNIHIYDQFNKFELTFSGWCANFSYLVFWYVSNLLVPRDIILMYSMSPLKDYIWFWDLFFCFFWIGGGVLIFFYFKKSIESFALSLFLMGFIYALPASIARPYMGFVIEPYWFYFSSIGFYLFVVLMLFKLRNKVGKGVYIFTLIVLSLSLFFCSQGVNHTASNKVSYYANWLKKSPGNLIPMRVLSIFYIYDEQWPITEAFTSDMLSAVDFYIANNYQDYAKRLIRKVSLSNLSLSQQKQLTFQVAAYHCKYGLKDQCRDVLRRILDSSKEPVIYMQLSHLFYKVGDNEMSIDLLRKCINLYPKYKEAYFVAGFMLSHQGRYQESIDLWQQGRDIDPSDLRFVSNINKTRKMIKK
ncbi:MAG: tetratricopeptide repeat protein [Candidatus Omnitrophota bacterium]